MTIDPAEKRGSYDWVIGEAPRRPEPPTPDDEGEQLVAALPMAIVIVAVAIVVTAIYLAVSH